MNTTEKDRSTYSDKLYSVCDFMFTHSDSFKNYAIYEDKLAFQSDKSISQDDKLALHNCLKNNFNFLTGQSDKTPKPGEPKGADIMPSLNLEILPEEKIAKILSIFYEYTRDNRQLSGKLFKIDTEKTSSLLNDLIKNLNSEYISEIEEIMKRPELQNDIDKIENGNYFKALEKLYDLYRINLIKSCEKYINFCSQEFIDTSFDTKQYITLICKMKFYYHILFDEKFKNEYTKEFLFLQQEFPQFGNFKELYYVWLYCDLFCHSLLQFLIKIFTNLPDHYNQDILEQLNLIILNLINKYPKRNIDASGSPEKVLFYFTAFYHFKDRLLQDTKMLKYLKENCGIRENPNPEYMIPVSWENRKDISLKNIQNRFTEGKEVNDKTFCKNYEICKEGIDKFNQKTNRKIRNSYLCQKAVYREIFMDKTKFEKNRHTSHNIFTSFIKNGSLYSSDYYFLNEKINLGIFRECGLIDEYYAKNELQENFYHLIVLILSRLYPEDIYVSLNEVIQTILENLLHLLSTNHSVPSPRTSIY